MKLRFYDTDGSEYPDFDAEAVIARLGAGDPQAWLGETGQAALSLRRETGVSWIFWSAAEPGAYFLYAQLEDGRRVYAAGSPERAEEEASVVIAGSRNAFSAKYLTGADSSAEVARQFMADGSLWTGVPWELDDEPFDPADQAL